MARAPGVARRQVMGSGGGRNEPERRASLKPSNQWPVAWACVARGDCKSLDQALTIETAAASTGRAGSMRTRQSGRFLRLLSHGSQLGSYEGEESPVEDRGLEPDKCSRSKRASLDSIAASRAFSFLSCSVSLSICFIRSSCCILRCSYCILRCSTPGSRRQLSVCNHKRH